MSRALGDAALCAALGLGFGVLLGMLAGGAYAAWTVGADVRQIDFLTILAFIEPPGALWREPGRTAALVAGGVALACAAAAGAAGWRRPLDSHGAARWASAGELTRDGLAVVLEAVAGPIFGKLGKPGSRARFLSIDRTPHSLIAAPTGSGKGVGVVIPTLLTFPGSVICLDLKGENFAKTARRRAAMGDRVFKLAPYDPEGRTHRYNPLDLVAQAPAQRRFTEARRLAASLIVARSRSAEGFVEGAREIFAATAVLAIERGEPTVAAVYDLLARPGAAQESFAALAGEAQDPAPRGVFNRMAAADGRVLSSYLSVLSEGGLSLWADPAVRAATAASDFALEGLRAEPASLFLVVAPNDLAPLAPLVRLLFEQAVAILQRAEPGPDERFPVLFLMDEFGSLGRMEALSAGITTLRSYGGRVMIVVQSMAHLRAQYGADGATHLLANCGVQLFMAPADSETPAYVSKAIGDFTRRALSRSWRRGAMQGATVQERLEGAALIRPEELRRLGEDRAVVLVQGREPAKVWKVRYYADRALKPLYAAQSGPLPEPPVAPQTALTPVSGPLSAQDRVREAPESPTAPPTSGASGVAAPAESAGPPADGRGAADLTRVAARQKAVLGGIAAYRKRAAATPSVEAAE